MWIKRDISSVFGQSQGPILIIRGPRQCGKSSLVLHDFPDFKEVSLDSPELRELAVRDPELFLNQFEGQKLFIDEAQYAPQLFSVIKRRIDILKRIQRERTQDITSQGVQYILTGSNQILMDKNVKESLAGRASYYDLNTLSVSEILDFKDTPVQEILFKGGWPELYVTSKDPVKYLNDYINTYIEKDIVLSAGIQKSSEFIRFIKLLAGRVGELVDYSSLGKDAGIDSKTVVNWLSVLEKMQIISLCQPFYSNLSKRLIKAPKVYFLDSGLAVRLQGWTSPEPLMTSPQQGHLFVNLVYSELYKLNLNFNLNLEIHHWRTRDNQEIDFLIKMPSQKYLFIEAKVSPQANLNLTKAPEVNKVFQNQLPQLIQVNQYNPEALQSRLSISQLKAKLLQIYL